MGEYSVINFTFYYLVVYSWFVMNTWTVIKYSQVLREILLKSLPILLGKRYSNHSCFWTSSDEVFLSSFSEILNWIQATRLTNPLSSGSNRCSKDNKLSSKILKDITPFTIPYTKCPRIIEWVNSPSNDTSISVPNRGMVFFTSCWKVSSCPSMTTSMILLLISMPLMTSLTIH